MCVWKEWKLPRTKVRKLKGLGVPKGKAYEWGNTRKSYWRISNSAILHRTLGNSYWNSQGLRSLSTSYEIFRQQSLCIRRNLISKYGYVRGRCDMTST